MGSRSRALVTALTAPMLAWYGYLPSGTSARRKGAGQARPGVLRSLNGARAAGTTGDTVAENTKESA